MTFPQSWKLYPEARGFLVDPSSSQTFIQLLICLNPDNLRSIYITRQMTWMVVADKMHLLGLHQIWNKGDFTFFSGEAEYTFIMKLSKRSQCSERNQTVDIDELQQCAWSSYNHDRLTAKQDRFSSPVLTAGSPCLKRLIATSRSDFSMVKRH